MENLTPEAIFNYGIIGWVIYHLLTDIIPEIKSLRSAIMDLQSMMLVKRNNPSVTNKELQNIMTKKDKDDKQ